MVSALFLKAGGSELAVVAQAGFLVLSLLGLLCGTVYNSLTPDLYGGSSHSRLGWVMCAFSNCPDVRELTPRHSMVLVVVLNVYDVYVFGIKFLRWRSGGAYASVTTEDEQAEPIHEPLAADDFVSSPTAMDMDVETTEVSWSSMNASPYDWSTPPRGM